MSKMERSEVSILIVEDSEFMAGLIKKTLNSAGYTNTQMASSGNKALEVLNEQVIDIIFLDINMEDGDGIFVLKHIYERFYQEGFLRPKCIVVSAVDQDEVRKEVSSYGAFGYIHKPFNDEEIIEHADKAATVIFK